MIPLGNMGCLTAKLVGNPTPPPIVGSPNVAKSEGLGVGGLATERFEGFQLILQVRGEKVFCRRATPNPSEFAGRVGGY